MPNISDAKVLIVDYNEAVRDMSEPGHRDGYAFVAAVER